MRQFFISDQNDTKAVDKELFYHIVHQRLIFLKILSSETAEMISLILSVNNPTVSSTKFALSPVRRPRKKISNA